MVIFVFVFMFMLWCCNRASMHVPQVAPFVPVVCVCASIGSKRWCKQQECRIVSAVHICIYDSQALACAHICRVYGHAGVIMHMMFHLNALVLAMHAVCAGVRGLAMNMASRASTSTRMLLAAVLLAACLHAGLAAGRTFTGITKVSVCKYDKDTATYSLTSMTSTDWNMDQFKGDANQPQSCSITPGADRPCNINDQSCKDPWACVVSA